MGSGAGGGSWTATRNVLPAPGGGREVVTSRRATRLLASGERAPDDIYTRRRRRAAARAPAGHATPRAGDSRGARRRPETRPRARARHRNSSRGRCRCRSRFSEASHWPAGQPASRTRPTPRPALCAFIGPAPCRRRWSRAPPENSPPPPPRRPAPPSNPGDARTYPPAPPGFDRPCAIFSPRHGRAKFPDTRPGPAPNRLRAPPAAIGAAARARERWGARALAWAGLLVLLQVATGHDTLNTATRSSAGVPLGHPVLKLMVLDGSYIYLAPRGRLSGAGWTCREFDGRFACPTMYEKFVRRNPLSRPPRPLDPSPPSLVSPRMSECGAMLRPGKRRETSQGQ